MIDRPQFHHSIRIARVERIRKRRQLGHSSARPIVIVLLSFLIAAGLAVGAYEIGSDLRHDQVMLPVAFMRAATTAGVFAVGGEFARHSHVKRIDTDLLLTTLPARDIALGVLLFEYSRAAVPISLPVFGVAVGFAVGTGSPISAVFIVVAAAGLLALSLLVGLVFRLAAELVAIRLPLARRHRRALSVVAYLLPLLVWPVAFRMTSLDTVFGWLRAIPFAWFVDLALLGMPGVPSQFSRSLGAVGLLVVGIPVLITTAIGLAERFWYIESRVSKTTQHSHDLLGDGIAEGLFGGVVPLSVRTVARKTWLRKRRVPLDIIGALSLLTLAMVPPVVLYATTGTVPVVVPLFVALAGAWTTGTAFGMNLLGNEYAVLPMTLTSVTGRQFVGGIVLAGVAVGVPVTVTATVVVGLLSPLDVIGELLVALAGGVLCVCGVTLAAAIGMGITYSEFVWVPPPFGSASTYAEAGKMAFARSFAVLATLNFVAVPAFVGQLSVLSEAIATTLGVPTTALRVGGLLLTVVVSGGVAASAYGRAARLFDQYTIR